MIVEMNLNAINIYDIDVLNRKILIKFEEVSKYISECLEELCIEDLLKLSYELVIQSDKYSIDMSDLYEEIWVEFEIEDGMDYKMNNKNGDLEIELRCSVSVKKYKID